jgi:hypothetical protein
MAAGAAETALLREIIALLQAGDLSGGDKLRRIGALTDAYRLLGLRGTLIAQTGLTVQAGPFAGMRWLETAAEGSYIPKLIGGYELELHDAVARIVEAGYARIVNIGCAEGYYAVGLKRLLPEADVFAFDIDEKARAHCAELARLNGVDLEIDGLCDPARLQALAGAGALVLCDIEGAETELIDPDAVPALRESTLLVELHPMEGGGDTGDILLPRFAASHAVEVIDPAGRDTGAYPALADWPQPDQLLALLERTEPTRWAFMTARV